MKKVREFIFGDKNRAIVGAFLILLLVVAFVWSLNKDEEKKLRQRGVKTKAAIYEYCNTKSCHGHRYRFGVDGQLYRGTTRRTDYPLNVGDTIVVFYLEDSPSVNRYDLDLNE